MQTANQQWSSNINIDLDAFAFPAETAEFDMLGFDKTLFDFDGFEQIMDGSFS